MSKNEITGDSLKTKPASALYREGWDAIFGKDKVVSIRIPLDGEKTLVMPTAKLDKETDLEDAVKNGNAVVQSWFEAEDEAAKIFNTARHTD